MKSALLIIDIQNDYFPGGRFALPGAEAAGTRAQALLDHCRGQGMDVVHIRHESVHEGASFFLPGTEGQEIHPCVAPAGGESVVGKHRPNSFLGTDLEKTLKDRGVEALVICGMMSNMCVDAGVRAASDLGFSCTVVHDACAAADLEFNGVKVPSTQVHAAFMAALAYGYAEVVSCTEFMEK